MDFVIEIFAGPEWQIVEMHGVKLARGSQREKKALAVVAEFDHRKKARIVELFGVRFYVAGVQARARFDAGGREQFILRILCRALKTDGPGLSFLLRKQLQRAEKKDGKQSS
ncbi:MAG: hypothetical protein ABR865_09630 [Terracidiphilus sp.]